MSSTEIYKEICLGVPDNHQCASGSCTEIATCVEVNCDTACNVGVEVCIDATGQKPQSNVKEHFCCDERNGHKNGECFTCNQSECPQCCDPHESLFFYCDICSRADNVTGTRNEGSDPKFACSCTPGYTWKTGGSSGVGELMFEYIETQKKINTVIIEDHNLCKIGASIKIRYYNGVWNNAEITTHDDNEVEVGGGCVHCGVEEECNRIVICFEDVDFNSINIQIVTEPGNVIEVGGIFIGRKFEFCLPEDWFNPFFGKSKEAKLDRTRCTQLATHVRKKIRSFSFSDSDACEDWVAYEWLPFLRAIENYEPFFFAWSIHQYPEHVAKLWLDDADGVQYDEEDGSMSLEFSATGFIT